MKHLLLIVFLLINTAINAQYATMNDFISDSMPTLRAGSCGSPDGPTTIIGAPPSDYQYLEDNGYCIYNYPTTNTFTGCYTFTSPGTAVTLNAGSSVSCNNRTFGNFQLYDASCNLVGTGLTFTGLTPGATYTWCLEMRAFGGPVCNGFDTFCPYFQDVTPLPVVLSDFIVSCDRVYWSTLSEVNNDYFIVERSSDGENWYESTVVLGSGNSNIVRYYYANVVSGTGINYYRLRQVDYDGKETIHKTLAINCGEYIEYEYFNVIGQRVSPDYGGYKIKRRK